jgi:glutathione S-transferase
VIELYHFAFSTCSQKVRLVLDEKSLAFTSREVNLMAAEQHEPEYVKLNPHHVVPTLVHDGRVFVESSLIIKYLDDAFPEVPMRPQDALGRYCVDAWLMHVDAVLHPAAPIVTFAIGPRKAILQSPPDVREANIAGIQDPAARATRRSVIEHGVQAPQFAGALAVFVETLDRMEADLADGDWLVGDHFGLADATLLPYVLRLEHLAMDRLVDAEERPGIASWFARVKALPSYASGVNAWAAPAAIEMMRANGKEAWPDVETILRSGPLEGARP